MSGTVEVIGVAGDTKYDSLRDRAADRLPAVPAPEQRSMTFAVARVRRGAACRAPGGGEAVRPNVPALRDRDPGRARERDDEAGAALQALSSPARAAGARCWVSASTGRSPTRRRGARPRSRFASRSAPGGGLQLHAGPGGAGPAARRGRLARGRAPGKPALRHDARDPLALVAASLVLVLSSALAPLAPSGAPRARLRLRALVD